MLKMIRILIILWLTCTFNSKHNRCYMKRFRVSMVKERENCSVYKLILLLLRKHYSKHPKISNTLFQNILA